MSRPRALVTNDDGITSPGLTALADVVAAAGYDVVIAAPASQSSGSSASLIAVEHDGRIAVEQREPDGYAAVYAVEATPGMIALLAAHDAFGTRPDVVLSGVNYGANVGRAILHSGTVGAALTAAYHGIPAMAVSLDVGLAPASEPQWQTAGHFLDRLLPQLENLPPLSVANLNIPDLPLVDVRGLRGARLSLFGTVQIILDKAEKGFLRTQLGDIPDTPAPDSDAALLAEGYATITFIESITEVPQGEVLGIRLD